MNEWTQQSSDEIDRLTPHARAREKKRRRGQHMTDEERKQIQDVFIKALQDSANVRAACEVANVSHTIIYQWQEHDTEFGIRFREANKDANWLLFEEAWQRAMKGEEKYVIAQGKIVMGPDGATPLTYHEKSDRMLELLLKARIPEFREKQQIEHVGKDGGPIEEKITIDPRSLSAEQLAELKRFALGLKGEHS